MLEKIKKILDSFNLKLDLVHFLNDLEELKKEFLGKESELNLILKSIKNINQQEKQQIGKLANEIRNEIISKLDSKTKQLKRIILLSQLEKEKLDVSLISNNFKFGTKHPLNLVIEEISDIFTEIGFQMVSGTEVEQDLYNFQLLNLPLNHPARDMQDTFYLNSSTVLRTHCTNITSRMLSKLASLKIDDQQLAVISYGNVYRRDDDDATHSHQFMQIDGFMIGNKISFANLKWILKYMCQRLFGKSVLIRMRPSYFPFTEPSVEVDVSCFKCQSQGCAICKYSGWIEILGAGMINQQVMQLNGLDPLTTTGLAFGIGIERICMLKFGITNIRDFYENNVKFLDQFLFYPE
ncbi:phenylalanine--tRNA ligase subunit alpha [Mycoplasma putrefaciens]|uniref:Phenylalanine--tRNA ligase alpha subunit n=2 Tax=Mycoplasma putrefaciens TaxID=2123 RepID=M9WA58_9MOLU|nr:phenylalanine--tRNA ligase subunit alpha [Mycoplasma putrefaciens]AEM68659.1 phenylalanyl-tRNA synthetase, alpha subunit [Mycoplasma putrefaciens KS1]AGJ90878.1 Phenylalanyl-tRNA synthetase alpha chain [Mycoplasma putrefaciens Mput9231]